MSKGNKSHDASCKKVGTFQEVTTEGAIDPERALHTGIFFNGFVS
jgi:hypothetical protein